jgi:hypothetical protein
MTAVVFVALALSIITACASSRNTATTAQDTGSAIVITADALHAEYKANEVAADGKYKDKTLEVSGTVQEIGKDALGAQYVNLSLASNQFEASVHCLFNDEH